MDGLDGLYDIKNKGAECNLDKCQLTSLVRDLDASPAEVALGAGAWTMPLVRMHIKKKFGVEYHVRSVWDLVLRLGFSRMKPRPHDIRRVSTQKPHGATKAYQRNELCAREGHLILSLDEMHMYLPPFGVPLRSRHHAPSSQRDPSLSAGLETPSISWSCALAS